MLPSLPQWTPEQPLFSRRQFTALTLTRPALVVGNPRSRPQRGSRLAEGYGFQGRLQGHLSTQFWKAFGQRPKGTTALVVQAPASHYSRLQLNPIPRGQQSGWRIG